jgi:hypothetical protein
MSTVQAGDRDGAGKRRETLALRGSAPGGPRSGGCERGTHSATGSADCPGRAPGRIQTQPTTNGPHAMDVSLQAASGWQHARQLASKQRLAADVIGQDRDAEPGDRSISHRDPVGAFQPQLDLETLRPPVVGF